MARLAQNTSSELDESATLAAAATSVQPQRGALDDDQALIAAQQGQSLSHYSAHLDQQAVSQAQPIDAAHQAQIINAQVAETELPQDWREVMPSNSGGTWLIVRHLARMLSQVLIWIPKR
ncbi:hypothetical protein [Vibrio sp. 03_296]|uniref:hypothetical protein n=1 Tax=Vibrio sp. 03_296 TaxID=2024409 RepID=UPI002D7EB0BA|nr:hypothetical protein [Vibrio sp. 03_296]